jgi:hypothetical protein
MQRTKHLMSKYCSTPLWNLISESFTKIFQHIVTLSLFGAVATRRKVAGSSPDEVDFFNLPNPSNHTMALGSTQPLTEMSTRNLPEGKGQPARKADNLTAICEPIV